MFMISIDTQQFPRSKIDLIDRQDWGDPSKFLSKSMEVSLYETAWAMIIYKLLELQPDPQLSLPEE